MERPSRRIRTIRMTDGDSATEAAPAPAAPQPTVAVAVSKPPEPRRSLSARLWDALLVAACCASLAWWAAVHCLRDADVNDLVEAMGWAADDQPGIKRAAVEWWTVHKMTVGIALATVAVAAVLLERALPPRRAGEAPAGKHPPAAVVRDVPAATLAAARAMLAAQDGAASAPTGARTLREVALLTQELGRYREGHADAGLVMQGNDVALLPLLLALMLHPAMRAAHADPLLRLKVVEEGLPAEGLKVPRHALLSMVRLALL
jgi:hypothetical protein